jgi:hypothetical protein
MNSQSCHSAIGCSPAHQWRRRADRVRAIATSFAGDPAEQRLLQLASEYEERAAQAEAAGVPGPP